MLEEALMLTRMIDALYESAVTKQPVGYRLTADREPAAQ
jgi:hypothetical protein